MKEADISSIKEISLPLNMRMANEIKLKHLEARLKGPNSDGNLPVEFKPNQDDLEVIKSRLSGKSDNNTNNEPINDNSNRNKSELNYFNLLSDSQALKSEVNNNSNKKTPPSKSEANIKPTKTYDLINNKRNRVDYDIYNLDNIESSNSKLEDNIEFSSKNISPITPLFSTKVKEDSSIINKFVIKSNSSSNSSNKNKKNDTNSNAKMTNEKHYIQTSINIKNNHNYNFNLNNVSALQTPDSNRMIKKVQDENDKLYKELSEIKKELQEKDKKISIIQNYNEDLNKNFNLLNKQIENIKKQNKQAIVKYLKELEEYRKCNKKRFINESEFKLGKFSLQRVGQSIIDIWEDGEEIIKLNAKLKEIENEKLNLDRERKNINTFKKRNTNDTAENEINDYKELINFKLTAYQKEETEIRENLSKLEIDKILMLIEKKRIKEEEGSRFRGLNNKDKFHILADRYLILSLLGKGGYSEVYRAYDLENNIEVACKIHQLNPNWSDSLKDNYIRHTIRENKIHKEVVHSKIVRHFDTIEIDQSSFSTVLELCSGPDLHTYLKMHKQLSEKESRGIVIQILAALEYLNKLEKKIIHFDLKPQNIIFNNMEVKISDFGLAKIVERDCDNIELTSQGVGTYWYLPPECFDTSRNSPGISSKVDIWSLGVILYELIYGKRPFGHNYTQDKILQEGVILNASKIEFPPKPVISKSCQDFLEKCLERKQNLRMDVFEALEHEFIKPRKNLSKEIKQF